MDEERKARVEKMVATKQLKLAMETGKKSKTREDGSNHTGSDWPLRQRKKEEQKSIGFELDLIWIEIGFF